MQVTLEKYKELNYARNEAFKALRTNISFCGEEIQVIGATSSVPNEGKSDCTFHLAHAFAQDGKRTLLIDADNRKSVLVSRYGVDQETKGLSHLLTGKASYEEVVCQTNLKNMDILFTGPAAPNPTELLGSKRFENLIDRARQEYDYIFIDCPPIGSVIDAAVVARNCDGMYMVVEQNGASYRMAQETKRQLELTNCPILGVVLSKVETPSKGYGYYKYGRYGRYGRYSHYSKYDRYEK